MSDHEKRVLRDGKNAKTFQSAAAAKLPVYIGGIQAMASQSQAEYKRREDRTLRAMALQPFSVMAEVEVEYREGNVERWLWYGGEQIELNMPLGAVAMPTSAKVAILAWTHPGLQVAMAEVLNDQGDLWDSGLVIVAVTPEVRARFERVLPELIGIYEPGGSVGRHVEAPRVERKPGLKSVKLGMTREQVAAFAGRMSGTLLVTGAPGSGKTTVALQRIRFLLDQQDSRENAGTRPTYDVNGVRVFLANRNLMQHTRNLLREDLSLPDSVVSLVPDFIESYVSDAWAFPRDARKATKKLRPLEARGREAIFGRIDTSDLIKGWDVLRSQVSKRLADKKEMLWLELVPGPRGQALTKGLNDFANSLKGASGKALHSRVAMDSLYRETGLLYEAARNGIPSGKASDRFDGEFAKWLYFVYDPIDSIRTYLDSTKTSARIRVQRATASRTSESEIVSGLLEDLGNRTYGGEALGWIALWLRLTLPLERDDARKFRQVPHAFATTVEPPTHVVIDEAQDLSASEAAFLASLVDTKGALTIAADFRQRVSPSKGIGDPTPVRFGAVVAEDEIGQPFRFSINMRQSFELTVFLKKFYENAFGEVPHFDVDPNAGRTARPQLIIGSDGMLEKRLVMLRNLLKRTANDESVAVLQVNTDDAQREWARKALVNLGLEIVDGASLRTAGAWTLANVEEIKGLEYDTCIVLGLDDIDAAQLDNFRNRAYVALSRPTRRLIMLCNSFPAQLKGISTTLYDRVNAQ